MIFVRSTKISPLNLHTMEMYISQDLSFRLCVFFSPVCLEFYPSTIVRGERRYSQF